MVVVEGHGTAEREARRENRARHRRARRSRPGENRERLERRRLRAARLFEEGRSQADVARLLHVSRTTASRWARIWSREGRTGFCGLGRSGRSPRLSEAQLKEIDHLLTRGPLALGYPSDLWTLPRITRLIRERTGVTYHPGHVWRLLRKLGWVRRKTDVSRSGRDAVGRWIKVGTSGGRTAVIRIKKRSRR